MQVKAEGNRYRFVMELKGNRKDVKLCKGIKNEKNQKSFEEI